MSKLKDNEDKCALCGGAFEKGWTDEESEKERTENGWKDENCTLICDDCYRLMKGNLQPYHPESLIEGTRLVIVDGKVIKNNMGELG